MFIAERVLGKNTFQRKINVFMGLTQILLGWLYTVPSDSSVALETSTRGVLSIQHVSLVLIATGIMLIALKVRPWPATLLTLPAVFLALFHLYETYRIVQDMIVTGSNSATMAIWLTVTPIGLIGSFWTCKFHEYVASSRV